MLPEAQAPNQSWSIDYVVDTLIDGRTPKTLMIVDDFAKECLAVEVDTLLPVCRVVAVLERLADRSADRVRKAFGKPVTLIPDSTSIAY